MPAHYTSHVSFQCPLCPSIVRETIDVPGTYWSGDSADERYVTDSANVTCGGCGTDFEVDIGNQDGTIFATLPEHPDTRVTASDAELQADPADIDWDLPEEPATVLMSTLHDIRALLDKHDDPATAGVLHRMAFSQQVAALEAYLGDFLLNQVKYKASALEAIVSGDVELKDRKLTLTEVLADPQAVKRTVAQHLQAQLYHNLPKVEMMYRTALSVSLFPDREVRTRLFAAMPIRHDCVHRNGFNKQGDRLTQVTAAFLRQIERDITAVANHLESRID